MRGSPKSCLRGRLGLTGISELTCHIQHTGPLHRGEHLFRAGDPSHELILVQSGCFKMYGVDPVGREYIPGFRLPGEVIGAHGFYSGFHRYNAIALSTSVVCLISARRLTEIAVVTPELLPTILRILGGEVFSHAFLTGSFSAEERVAAFLSDFAYRWQDAVQTNDLQLPMSRSEIAIYLRLAMATVSRILSRMGREKIIEVDHHHIHIRDQDHLRLLCRNVPFAEHQPR